jgi:hypothetical protein
MKMKRVTLGFSVLTLAAFVFGCKKEKDEPPVADTETESAVYASFANYVASDIEMACSFMGENAYNSTFYSEYSAATGTVAVVRDTNAILIDGKDHDQLTMTWNDTKCKDGRVRKGTIFMYVPQIVNQRYARNYKFQARVRFDDFKVDGWKINLYDSAVPCYLYNTLSTPTINTKTEKLTWKFAGKLKFTHPTDPKKDIVWEGELNKTLVNTDDPLVFAANQLSSVTWSLGIISYHGYANGTVPQIDANGVVTPGVNYKMTFDNVNPLVRDFKCSPDKVSGVTISPTGSLITIGDEHHPFKTGVASFTVGDLYPRQIYYGNEGEPQLELQCDNTGEVLIKGTSYKVTFFK